MLNRFFKRIFALLGIIFITFLPVMTQTAYAVTSWSGDPWSGSPWSGESWDGSNLQWSGDSWNGESWTGEDWSSDSWNSSGWNGNTWNGNSWTTQPWNQNGWNSSGFNGNSWTQQGWNGSHFQGNSWTNSGWNGSNFQGNPWASSGWSMYGFNGNPWLSSSWTGNGVNGNPWSSSGWNGNGINGSPWASNGWNSGPFAGDPGSGTTIGPAGPIIPGDPNTPFYDTDEFKVSKFVWDNMVNAAIDIETNYPNGLNGLGPNGLSPNFFRGFMADSIKLQLGNHAAVDLYDIGDKGYSAYDSYRQLDGLRQAAYGTNAAQVANHAYQVSNASKLSQFGNLIKDSTSNVLRNTDFANMSSTWGSMGAVSKLNFVASGINAGISAYKTGESVSNAINTWQSTTDGSERTAAVADIGANLGETLMSVGGVAAAIPGGQAVGAGLMVVGGGLFVISKGTQLVAKNWDKIAAFGKKVGNGLKNARKKVFKGAVKAGAAVYKGAKKLGSTIKGWFS